MKWTRAPIGALCDIKNGMAFKPSDWKRDGMKIVRIQNLNNPDAPYNYFDGEIRDRFIIDTGDLLFAWSGTPGTSFGAHIWRGERAVLNQHIFRVDFDESVLVKKFFRLAINQKLNELIDKAHGGAGLQHVTKGRFEETLIEIPPLREQHRIVAKIEELFSELDKAVESLRLARAQLKTYRQALLKAAFEGKLTADWRAANADKLEPPETLLARIRAEREARYKQALADWQTALAKWRAGGEVGRKPGKPRRTEEEFAQDDEFAELNDLPRGWSWHLLAQVADHIVDGTHKTPSYKSQGIPFISAKDIFEFRISFLNTRFISRQEHEELSRRCRVRRGNVLITKSGTIGRVAIVDTDDEFSLFESVANVPVSCIMNPRYVGMAALHLIETYFGAAQQKGVAVRHLHLEDLRRLPIPICSWEEQCAVVQQVDTAFSSVDAIEGEINVGLEKINALRQSILKQAFSGQLVPQDPADEPAAALLARLREQAPPARTRRRNTNGPGV